MNKILIFILIFTCGTLYAVDESAFSAHVDAAPVVLTVDDTVTVTLTLTYPAGYEPDRQQLRQNLLNSGAADKHPFALVSEHVAPAVPTDGGRVTETYTYILEPWQEGDISITFRDIQFKAKDGATQSSVDVWTDINTIQIKPRASHGPEAVLEPTLLPPPGVMSLGIDAATRQLLNSSRNSEKELPRNVEIVASRTFPWEAVITLAVLVTLGWLLRHRLGAWIGRLRQGMAPALSPIEKALRRLQHLKHQGLPEQGLFEPYYVQLTEIIRQFIEEQYHLNAPEQTTEEFLQEVSSHGLFNDDMQRRLGEFLGYADLVKFARHSTTKEECREAYQAAERLITADSGSSVA